MVLLTRKTALIPETTSEAATFVTYQHQTQDAVSDYYNLVQNCMALTFHCYHTPPTFGDRVFIQLTQSRRILSSLFLPVVT